MSNEEIFAGVTTEDELDKEIASQANVSEDPGTDVPKTPASEQADSQDISEKEPLPDPIDPAEILLDGQSSDEKDAEKDSDDIDAAKKSQTRVPLSALQKVRRQKQHLQAENERLREELSQLESQPDNDDEDDESPISRAQAKALADKAAKKTDLAARIERNKASLEQTGETEKTVHAELKSKIAQSKEKAVKAHSDFDKVMEAAKALNLINPVEIEAARASDDPCEFLYSTQKKKLDALRSLYGGHDPAPNENRDHGQQDTIEDDENEVDTNNFSSLFNGR
jgi:hypothetical protein